MRKRDIARLVRGLDAIRACPTRLWTASARPFVPGCAKPDLGQGGAGLLRFESARAWRERGATPRTDYVLQPWLVGVEFRATVCAHGAFAVARLTARKRQHALWSDATARFPRVVLADLLAIVRRLRAPAIGFDVMRVGDAFFVLDVNVNPSLAIHEATARPRRLADAYLDAWLTLTASDDATDRP